MRIMREVVMHWFGRGALKWKHYKTDQTEILKAMKKMKCGKSPEMDGIKSDSFERHEGKVL